MVELREFHELPAGFARLRAAAESEGFQLLERLEARYREGTGFAGPGEGFFAATDGDRLLGVAGLCVDPYLEDPSVGRVRHVYVDPDARRGGIGRALVELGVVRAAGAFARLRLRSDDARGDAFYRSLGFAPADEAGATHVLEGDALAARAPDAEAFLDFWFADSCESSEGADARGGFWFQGGEATDRACAAWAPLLAEAAAGRLDAWAEAPRSALALVIALDQLPRNLRRGGGGAFAHDARSLALADRAVDAGWDEGLAVPEAAFLLMPYQHAEDRAAQRRGGERYEAIVERFGRFPHRNASLGRTSTPEETAWLDGGGDTFGQG